MIDILMLICGTWYVSFASTKLRGPFGIFADMRKRPVFKIMTCIYCFSFWAGLYLYILLYFGYPEPVYVFGTVGAAHLLASFTGANYGASD
jgi:hypothetical protein